MEFYDVVAQVVQLLQQQGRVTYRGLKFQFKLDDEALGALKEEIIEAQRVAVEEDGRILVWTGSTELPTVTTNSQPDQAESQPTAQEEPSTQVTSPLTEPHAPDAERL